MHARLEHPPLRHPRTIVSGRHAAAATVWLATIILAIAAFFAHAAGARATPVEAGLRPVAPGEVKSGSLLLRSDDGERYVDAPRLGTDFDVRVSGPTARTRVTQHFRNPTAQWVEAMYVFPLPDGGAVDALKMVVGDRVVVGDIKERREAKVIYEQAKAAGQKAALLEQERANIFTNTVANIGPGETVVVQIEFQETVRQSNGVFSLRLPLVVAPRYSPAPIVQTVDFDAQGNGFGRLSDPVPDRDRIAPEVLDPRLAGPVNPVTITVDLAAGFPLAEVKSHHHAIKSETIFDDTRVVKLEEGAVPADRDFELTWTPVTAKAPAVGLFREKVGEHDYLLAFVTPPAAERPADRRDREIVFVIDNSGSMGGTSIVQAKASLLFALSRLAPGDRFNVIRFDNNMDILFSDTVPADPEHVARARRFVEALQASGGTEMVAPMRAALADPRGAETRYLRQVVFLTDGAVGNEQQLFDLIGAMRGRSRVFMVGIGSAPNTHLMSRASELGRGTFTHIGSAEQVETRMRALFEKLESPAVTDLSVKFSATKADVTPPLVPDLYRGEPIVLAARVDRLAGDLTINGMLGEQPWSVTLPLGHVVEKQGISKLWARRKIADAEVARALRQSTPEEAERRILALGLDHHLVTRMTSLVAVDRTPSRPDGARLSRAELPLNLPAGWDFDKVFGERNPQPRPANERRADGASNEHLRTADAGTQAKKFPQRPAVVPVQAVRLPQTATDAEIRMASGLALLAAGLTLALIVRRRRYVGMS